MGDCENCSSLQEQVKESRGLMNSRQKTIDDLNSKVDLLTENLDSQIEQFELMREESRSQREKFSKEKNDYEDKLATQKSEIDTLHFQIVEAKGRENLLLQEKGILEDKVTLVTTQRDGYLAQVRQLSAQVRSLQEGQELKKKEQEYKKLEDELKDFQQQLLAEQNRSQGLQDEILGCQKTLADYLEMPNQALTKYVSVVIAKNENLIREKDKQKAENAAFENQINELKQAMENLDKEKEEMKQNLEKIEKKYGSLDAEKTLYQYKEIKADKDTIKCFYDCRILADSFFPLLQDQPWRIEFKDWANYKKRINELSVRVSVLGYENTGKSFMISRVMGYEVPQGKQTKTTGICILYPRDSTIPWTALDTPGTNISIRTEYMKSTLDEFFTKKEKSTGKELSNEQKLRMLYGDNILIESLLQEFVVNNTQVLLIVVGKMRRDDQRFINRIKHQKELSSKRVIIVHNLMDCTTLEDVANIIQEDIIDTFGAQKRAINVSGDLNKYVYLEKDKKKTEHVILAHQDSPAGKHYNESAIEYIKNVIATSPYSEIFDLVESFKAYLNASILSYLSTASPQVSKQPFILDYGASAKGEIPESFKLEANELFDLKLNFTDEFGQIRTYAEDLLETVPFVVKIVSRSTSKGEERLLQVEFEVSGTCNDKEIKKTVQVNNNLVVIRIKGKSEDNNKREDGEMIKQNTRKFGEFLITTNPIDLEGFTIFKGEEPTISSDVPGLKTISFKLYSEKFDDDF